MAEWKQQKLGNPKILEDIGKRADQAIEAVNTAMGIIKTGGEVAKLVLLSSMNPVLLAMKAVGEAIVDMAGNYREAGFYALYVGYGDGSTAKVFEDYGLAQLRDKDGNFLMQNAYYKVTGQNSVGEAAFEVYRNYPVDTTTEPKFVKSLNQNDLSDNCLDYKGRNKTETGFSPPVPQFEYPWRFVRGGWNPDSWFSHENTFWQKLATAPNFPQIPATAVVQAMIDAFDDEGDVPLYAWSAGTSIDVNTTPVYTREGVPVQNSKQQYARIGSQPNPGGQLSAEDKVKWEISASNWKNTLEKGATFYTHLYNKKESLRPSTSVWGSSTFTTVVKSGKPAFKGVGDITIPAETKLVKTGTAGEKTGGTLGANIGTYEVQEIAPAKTIPIPNNVVGIAIVAGLADYKAFYDLFNTLMNFFGDWPAVKDAIDDIGKLLQPKRQNIQLEQDVLWGGFEPSGNIELGADPEEGDRYMIGATSGAVGKIITMISGGQDEDNRISKWMMKDVYIDRGEAGPPIVTNEAVDTNDEPYLKRWYMHEYKIESVSGQDFDFTPGEYVYQIKDGDGVRRDTYTYDEYWVPSSEGPLSEEFLEQKVFKGESRDLARAGGIETVKNDIRSDMEEKITAMDLPPYGIVTGAEFENPPASIAPDFVGFQLKEFIPYWAEVFDGIAMFGQAIVDIAEALLAFIQKIIDFIDLVIEKLQELANAIISFINYFKIGIPEQGIYLLGVSTSDGNQGIQEALKNADNAPPASLKYSSGILLVGVTDNTGVNGVEMLGQLLALDFTDFSVAGITSGEFAKGDPATAEVELAGTGLEIKAVFATDEILTDEAGKVFSQIASFTVNNQGSGYTKIPSITIASSGSVVKFRQPDLKSLANTGITHYVEEPTTGTYNAPTFDINNQEAKLVSPGYGYTKAPTVYIGGGGKPFSNTITKLDGTDFNYHTTFTTTLSKAPKARGILDGDKITSVSLDSSGDSYFVTTDGSQTYPQISIGGVPLKSIKITEGGRLYKEIPRLSFVPGSGGGRGAVAEVTSLGSKGEVKEIELISPGEEYTSPPEIKISKP